MKNGEMRQIRFKCSSQENKNFADSNTKGTKDTKEGQRNSSRPGTNLIVSNTDGEHSSDPEIGRFENRGSGPWKRNK